MDYNVVMLAIISGLFVLVIGLQSFWISRALGRVETAVDALTAKVDRLSERVLHLEQPSREQDD